MVDNPFQSPEADLNLPDRPPPMGAYHGRMTLASFGARSGARIGAILGVAGGTTLGLSLGIAYYEPMELGGRPAHGTPLELTLALGIGGGMLSCLLGAVVGLVLGEICDRRPHAIGLRAMLLGAFFSAIGAAGFTGIAAGLIFDSEPFNLARSPLLMTWLCIAYGFALGFLGGALSGRRIGDYDRWRRDQTRRHGNEPL